MTSAGFPDMAPMRQTRTSGMAVTGFVLGFFMCLPVVGGLAAIICSVLGLRATRDPNVQGRGLAVAGLVLGIISLLFWLVMGGVVFLAFLGTAAPRGAWQDFTKKVAAGDIPAAVAEADAALPQRDIEDLAAKMKSLGTYEGATSYSTNLSVENMTATCKVAGTMQFSGTAHAFSAELEKETGTWKVKSFTLRR